MDNFEDRGISGSKIRLSNNSWFVSSSHDNKKDIPVFRVNEADKIEFADLPIVKGLGPLATESGGNSGQNHFLAEFFTITSTMISTKSLTLTKTPTIPSQVLIFPIGGIIQSVFNDDFFVEGNVISWAGKNLEFLLSVDDKVVVLFPF